MRAYIQTQGRLSIVNGLFLRVRIAMPQRLSAGLETNQRVPLVEGTPRTRGSSWTAFARARAVALKIPSAKWWLLRP